MDGNPKEQVDGYAVYRSKIGDITTEALMKGASPFMLIGILNRTVHEIQILMDRGANGDKGTTGEPGEESRTSPKIIHGS